MFRTTLPATLLVLALAGSSTYGCESQTRSGAISSSASSAEAENGARVTGAEARRLVAEENAFLLDVRTPGEFAGGHIDGATNIDVGELSARLSEVPSDRPVVVYCQSGGRSARAASTLVEAGRTVHDLGGIGDW